MPRQIGRAVTPTGRIGCETYEPHELTKRFLQTTLNVSDMKGRNNKATKDRVMYMKQAMKIGLVQERYLPQAVKTILNLEEQIL
jgi:hypothetical protein